MTGGPFAQYGPKLRVIFPRWTGGTNWGGGSFDPDSGLYLCRYQRSGQFQQTCQAARWIVPRVGPDNPPANIGDYFWDGTKHWPCQQPPWARLIAVNVNTGEIAWQVPLGSFEELDRLGVPKTGTPTTNGGGIVTAGGLVFIGASTDGKFQRLRLPHREGSMDSGSGRRRELDSDHMAGKEWKAVPCLSGLGGRASRSKGRPDLCLFIAMKARATRSNRAG